MPEKAEAATKMAGGRRIVQKKKSAKKNALATPEGALTAACALAAVGGEGTVTPLQPATLVDPNVSMPTVSPRKKDLRLKHDSNRPKKEVRGFRNFFVRYILA